SARAGSAAGWGTSWRGEPSPTLLRELLFHLGDPLLQLLEPLLELAFPRRAQALDLDLAGPWTGGARGWQLDVLRQTLELPVPPQHGRAVLAVATPQEQGSHVHLGPLAQGDSGAERL